MTHGKLKDLAKEQISFECPAPNKDLYHFDAQIKQKGGTQNPVDLKSFIPLGSTVQNSMFVYAQVIYTCKDTKMAMN